MKSKNQIEAIIEKIGEHEVAISKHNSRIRILEERISQERKDDLHKIMAKFNPEKSLQAPRKKKQPVKEKKPRKKDLRFGKTQPNWTKKEKNYLIKNRGKLTMSNIARDIGRTERATTAMSCRLNKKKK